MGVGCIRFKKLETVPYDLITELMGKISATEWISLYEKAYRTKKIRKGKLERLK